MKIKITENGNVKEVEFSLGLSAKNKKMLKSFAEKTINTVVNTGAEVAKKVNDFADKIAEEETRDVREHMAEIVKEAKEDAQRIVDEAKLFYYLDSLKLYTCENLDSTQEAKKFMKVFKYPLTPCSIQAYKAALKVSKISFESILNEFEIFGETREDIIENLKIEFDVWLKTMPDVKENCPNVNLIHLLKYFVKKYRNEKTSNFGDVENEINDEVENANVSEIEMDNAIETEDEIEEPKEEVQEEIDKNDEKVENDLEEKISKIPKGKIFTLAEYLDYTEEGNCIKDTSVFDHRSEIFLDTIKFPWSQEALEAFSRVANLKKPSYEVLSKNLSIKYNRDIVNELKKDFEAWLKGRPDVKKYCPKANLWQLLLYYRKKVNEAIRSNQK